MMAWYDRLLNLTRTRRLNAEIERELAFHVAERADALRSAGMPEEQALREARRRLGNATLQRERTRDADVPVWADSVLRDAKHAVRGLRKAPVFTLVAVASLALGIGANAAIFTLVEAVILRPLPVPSPEELVVVGVDDGPEGWFTHPLWEQLRDRPAGLSAIAAFSNARFNAAEGGEARWLNGTYVSGDYFRLFGVRPAAGRLLTPADDVRGCPPLAVLGHGHWRREHGGDAGALGTTITLEGVRFEVVGVTPAGFSGPEVGREPHVYVPLCATQAVTGRSDVLEDRSWWWLRIVGRRERGVDLEQVNARLTAISAAAFESTVPERYDAAGRARYAESRFTATAAPAGVSGLRTRYASSLGYLMAGVGLVLLISCANVANLMLARAAARRREFAIRAAIGAGRARIVRQLVTESLLLALAGAAAGLLLARFGAAWLTTLIADAPGSIALDLSLNTRILAFTAGMAGLTALLFGMVPAWRAARMEPHAAMGGRSRGIAEGDGRFTLGKTLVAAQVALSLVLLMGAGLLVGSLRNLVMLDPGFTTEGVLIASVDMRRTGFEDASLAAAHTNLRERLRAVPGVSRASTTDVTPIGVTAWNGRVVVEGFTPATERDDLIWFNQVSDDYFATLDVRFLAGRDFDARDAKGGTRVAVVNQSMAHRFFGEASPIGRAFYTRRGDVLGDPVTIIGVVHEAKYTSLREETSPTAYLAATQADSPPTFVSYLMRTNGDPAALIPAAAAALAEVNPAIGVDFTTLSDQVARSLRRERALAVLSALFGAVALGLAMIGLYGVMSYTVSRRRNEIGVRVALGAHPGRVIRLVLGDVGRVVALGLAAGAIGAIAAGRLIAGFLYDLSAAEPVILALAAVLLAAVALLAGAIPAWRAGRVDPVAVLREE